MKHTNVYVTDGDNVRLPRLHTAPGMRQNLNQATSFDRPPDALTRIPLNLPLVESRRITVVFRYDDCNGESSIFLERHLIEAFRSHSMPFTIGVTPFVTSGEVDDASPCPAIPLGLDKIELLKHVVETLDTEIALHGISHQTIRPSADGGCTEFAGLTLCAQRERLDRGRRFLEATLQVPVTTLIPPWNSYDENTLRAAYASGFTTVSGDTNGLAPCGSPLQFVPFTCTLVGLKSAIRWARMSFDPAPVITVLFHPYDFARAAQPRPMTIDQLLNLLSWVRGQADVSTATIAGLGLRGADVSAERLDRYQAARGSLISRLIPGHASRSRVYGSTR